MLSAQLKTRHHGKTFPVLLIITLLLLSPALTHAHDNIQVHPYIAEQAFYLWPDSKTHELWTYLGEGYRDDLGKNYLTIPEACNNAKEGSIITEGAKEEDDYDPIDKVCNIDLTNLSSIGKGYYHHFYDPDIAGIDNGLLDYPGAENFAEQYWQTAKALYADAATRGASYWYLGRIAHLLADISVPAHVHREPHIPFIDPDAFESYMMSNYQLWTAADAAALDISEPVPHNWSLQDIFYNLAQRSQYFPSNTIVGNITNSDPDWFIGWPETTGWISGNGRLSGENLAKMGDKLMPLAIQYTAALYRLFWREVHPEQRDVMLPPAGTDYFSYPPTVSPAISAVASAARPVGVGYVAKGGGTLSLKIAFPEFPAPVDIYLALYFPEVDGVNLYVVRTDYGIAPVTSGITKWKTTSGPVDESLYGNIAIDGFPAGAYYIYAVVTPQSDLSSYYIWQTEFRIE